MAGLGKKLEQMKPHQVQMLMRNLYVAAEHIDEEDALALCSYFSDITPEKQSAYESFCRFCAELDADPR